MLLRAPPFTRCSRVRYATRCRGAEGSGPVRLCPEPRGALCTSRRSRARGRVLRAACTRAAFTLHKPLHLARHPLLVHVVLVVTPLLRERLSIRRCSGAPEAPLGEDAGPGGGYWCCLVLLSAPRARKARCCEWFPTGDTLQRRWGERLLAFMVLKVLCLCLE